MERSLDHWGIWQLNSDSATGTGRRGVWCMSLACRGLLHHWYVMIVLGISHFLSILWQLVDTRTTGKKNPEKGERDTPNPKGKTCLIHLDSSSLVDVSLWIWGGSLCRSKAKQKEEQWWEEPGPQDLQYLQDPQDPQDPQGIGQQVRIGPKDQGWNLFISQYVYVCVMWVMCAESVQDLEDRWAHYWSGTNDHHWMPVCRRVSSKARRKKLQAKALSLGSLGSSNDRLLFAVVIVWPNYPVMPSKQRRLLVTAVRMVLLHLRMYNILY